MITIGNCWLTRFAQALTLRLSSIRTFNLQFGTWAGKIRSVLCGVTTSRIPKASSSWLIVTTVIVLLRHVKNYSGC